MVITSAMSPLVLKQGRILVGQVDNAPAVVELDDGTTLGVASPAWAPLIKLIDGDVIDLLEQLGPISRRGVGVVNRGESTSRQEHYPQVAHRERIVMKKKKRNPKPRRGY